MPILRLSWQLFFTVGLPWAQGINGEDLQRTRSEEPGMGKRGVRGKGACVGGQD